MPRLVDLVCKSCGHEERDRYVQIIPDKFECGHCGGESEEVWWGIRSTHDAQWGDRDAVVVFRDAATGNIRYPGRNDRPTPAGYERLTMRSLREVEAFEKSAKVTCEAMHYDSGSGTARPDEHWRGERMNH